MGEPEGSTQECLGGRRPQAHDRSWVHHPDLRIQPGPAGRDLLRGRLLVDPPLPARLELEVLHHVRHVDLVAVDPPLPPPPAPPPAGPPAEGGSREGPAVPRPFAHPQAFPFPPAPSY